MRTVLPLLWLCMLALPVGALGQTGVRGETAFRLTPQLPQPDQLCRVSATEPLLVRVVLSAGNQPWRGEAKRWAKLVVRTSAPRPLVVELFDDGVTPDETAADGIWTGAGPTVVADSFCTSQALLRWMDDGQLTSGVWVGGPSFRLQTVSAASPATVAAPPDAAEDGAAPISTGLLIGFAVMVAAALVLGLAQMRVSLRLEARLRQGQAGPPEPRPERLPDAWAELFRAADVLRREAVDLSDVVGAVRNEYRDMEEARMGLRDGVTRAILVLGDLEEDAYPIPPLARRLGQILEDADPDGLNDPDTRQILRRLGMILEGADNPDTQPNGG